MESVSFSGIQGSRGGGGDLHINLGYAWESEEANLQNGALDHSASSLRIRARAQKT